MRPGRRYGGICRGQIERAEVGVDLGETNPLYLRAQTALWQEHNKMCAAGTRVERTKITITGFLSASRTGRLPRLPAYHADPDSSRQNAAQPVHGAWFRSTCRPSDRRRCYRFSMHSTGRMSSTTPLVLWRLVSSPCGERSEPRGQDGAGARRHRPRRARGYDDTDPHGHCCEPDWRKRAPSALEFLFSGERGADSDQRREDEDEDEDLSADRAT